MKNLLKLLLISPILFSLGGCKEKKEEPVEPKPIDVIIISGQSNAVGCTHSSCITRSIGASKYQEYMRGYPEIQIAFDSWTKDEIPNFYSQNSSKDYTFMKVMLGQGNSLSTFGPEIGIAQRMHEKYADKLAIIKFACGASNLKDDWLSRTSPMYPKMMEFIALQIENLKKMNYIPTVKAFCWMQGEGDAWDGYYQDYLENTTNFVAHIREDLKQYADGNEELPFIDAGISKAWTYWRKVNQAKKAFSELSENNIYIDTIELGLHTNEEPFDSPDTAHYDSESEVQLGELFAEAFEPYLMKD